MPVLSQAERVRREIESKRREHAREVVLPLIRSSASLSAGVVTLIHENGLGDLTLAEIWPDGSGGKKAKKATRKKTAKKAKKKAAKRKKAKKATRKKKGGNKKAARRKAKKVTRGLGDRAKQWPTKEALLWDMKERGEPASLQELTKPYKASLSTVRNRVFALEEEGLVRREGSGKTTRYGTTAKGAKRAAGRRPRKPKA